MSQDAKRGRHRARCSGAENVKAVTRLGPSHRGSRPGPPVPRSCAPVLSPLRASALPFADPPGDTPDPVSQALGPDQWQGRRTGSRHDHCNTVILQSSRISHSFLADWSDGAGLRHSCQTPSRTLTCQLGFRRTDRTCSIAWVPQRGLLHRTRHPTGLYDGEHSETRFREWVVDRLERDLGVRRACSPHQVPGADPDAKFTASGHS